MGSGQEPTKSTPPAPASQICSTTMLFAAVKLLLLPSALGLVRFPPVQKVPRELRFCEDDPTALSNDPESDAYVDQILANLATGIIENGLDPATLPDADTSFSDTILGITFHGSAHLFNGRFWRLSTIHRTGDTSFTVDGTKVRLTGELSIVLLPWDFKLGMPINQHRGGGPHRPLRCLSGVHGHRGVRRI